MTMWKGAVSVAAIALAIVTTAFAAEKPANRAVGSTTLRAPVPLDSRAMNAMLRADRDKDGTLSRDELERHDLGLARRFKEADADGDGKLTLYEFETLLAPQPVGATR